MVISPVKFSLVIITFSGLLNMLLSRHGDTILFHLPDHLPLVGGVFTLEALVYGAINGLVLANLFTAFTVINQALPVQALIRLIPRAFYPVAVVTSIAITFVPTTLRQFNQIREAQAVRGHRLRGLRDWLPLFLPLLVGGLERAMALAEAMTARGFSQTPTRDHQQFVVAYLYRLILMASLGVLMVGWLIHLLMHNTGASLSLMITGGVGMIIATRGLGRQSKRSSYRQEQWHWNNLPILCGAAFVVLNYLLPLPELAQASRMYNPYPQIQLPPFHPIGGLLLLSLLSPVFLLKNIILPGKGEEQEEPTEVTA